MIGLIREYSDASRHPNMIESATQIRGLYKKADVKPAIESR